MDTVNIGIIGCGGMGMNIVRRLVQQEPRLRMAAIYDPDPRSVDNARKELGDDPIICSDYQQIMDMPDIDWVLIASWNCQHCEQTVAAFEAGKHVFCQKPLALNIDECIQMLAAWKNSGKMFNIGFTLRYSPHYRKIRQLIADGAIGDIISMEFNETLDFNHGAYIMGDWRRLRKYAGTHLLEKCCHDIDLTNWMVGNHARRVASFGGLNFFRPENAHHAERIEKSDEGKQAYHAWEGLIAQDPFTSDKDIVDNQVAILEYANGTRATFHANCNAGIPERRMYILGSEGAIRANVLSGEIQTKRIGFDTPLEDVSTDSKGGHGGGDEVLSAELIDSMLNHTPPSVGIPEGLLSAVTCFAIDEAMDTGTVVELEPYWQKIRSVAPDLLPSA